MDYELFCLRSFRDQDQGQEDEKKCNLFQGINPPYERFHWPPIKEASNIFAFCPICLLDGYHKLKGQDICIIIKYIVCLAHVITEFGGLVIFHVLVFKGEPEIQVP